MVLFSCVCVKSSFHKAAGLTVPSRYMTLTCTTIVPPFH